MRFMDDDIQRQFEQMFGTTALGPDVDAVLEDYFALSEEDQHYFIDMLDSHEAARERYEEGQLPEVPVRTVADMLDDLDQYRSTR